jgi:hypothetical protein
MRPIRVYVHPGYEKKSLSGILPEPFRNAEQAWFWTMAALVARREGTNRPSGAGVPRPCEPDDVVRCLDGLYRRKRIDLSHARALSAWGERGMPPDWRSATERREARLWTEAMRLLEWPLRVRGIVVPPANEF